MSQPDRFAPAGGLSRNTVIVGSVVLFHVAAIWALQSGLVRKAAEVIVPAELLSAAAERELPQLDEQLYFQVFAKPAPASKRTASAR